MDMNSLNLKDYSSFFVDMDGVIVMHDQRVPGSVDSLSQLANFGDIYVLSNNSTRTRKRFAKNLAGLGIDLPASSIINSAFVLAKYLRELKGATKAFVVGEEGLDKELELMGHEIVQPAEAEVIAVGMDRDINYDKLDGALSGLLSGAEFYGTNADKTFPTPEGQSPGAGASVGAVKGMGFEPERIVGKPSSVAAEVAMEVAGTDNPEDCLVIGDRLETDILMAERAGMDSALVLTGVETRESLKESDIDPSYVFDDLCELVASSISV
ncbi:HAD-IIA family hydrolase [Candidatus Bipolaricaulota bacterium]|nr:HAD-IIA family hydrolase [Candidatus Bipolaricaulota bacterium]